MKAIVTGASGFIGSRLVAELVKTGYEVASIGRRSIESLSDIRIQLLKNSDYVEADLDNPDSIIKKLKALGYYGSDLKFLFHFAWGGDTRLSDLNVGAQNKNINRTVATYEIANALQVERYIFCGTMEESFAEQYTQLDYKVDNKYNRHVVYALAKISARHALKLLFRKDGPAILFGTNSHVIGPGDDKDSFLQVALSKILNGQDIAMSSGDQRFDVINVTDCAKAYLAIAENGITGESYWVGSGTSRTLKEYVEEMKKLFPKVNIHYGSLPYNDVLLEESVFDIKKLTCDTGFAPIFSFSDSVKELANYLRMNHFN